MDRGRCGRACPPLRRRGRSARDPLGAARLEPIRERAASMNEWDQEKFEREILDEVERVSAKPKVVVRKAANGDVRAQRVSPSSPPGYGIHASDIAQGATAPSPSMCS